MNKLIIMAGLPGSGKSTYVKNNFKGSNVFHIDSDETRKQMFGSYLIFPKNMYEIYDKMIEEANEIYDKNKGKDIIIIMDSTFLDNYRRNYYLDHLRHFDVNILIMFKTTDIKKNLDNNKKRIKEKWVPEDVIFRMVDEYEELDEYTRNRFEEVIEIII